MSDFKAKMHQIRFRLGLGPYPGGGAYSVPPDSLAGFKGPTSKGKEEREGQIRGKEVRFPHSKFLDPPLLWASWPGSRLMRDIRLIVAVVGLEA